MIWSVLPSAKAITTQNRNPTHFQTDPQDKDRSQNGLIGILVPHLPLENKKIIIRTVFSVNFIELRKRQRTHVLVQCQKYYSYFKKQDMTNDPSKLPKKQSENRALC